MSNLAEGRKAVIARVSGAPSPRVSSLRLMPAEPDLLWDLLSLDARFSALRASLETAPHTKAIGIAEEMRSNRERAAILRDQVGLSEDASMQLGNDTAPVTYAVAFSPMDGDGGDAPHPLADGGSFVIAMRGHGYSFAASIAGRLEIVAGDRLLTAKVQMSRHTSDWEYIEFSDYRSLSEMGAIPGSSATMLLDFTLKSGRKVSRAVKRFTCE